MWKFLGRQFNRVSTVPPGGWLAAVRHPVAACGKLNQGLRIITIKQEHFILDCFKMSKILGDF